MFKDIFKICKQEADDNLDIIKHVKYYVHEYQHETNPPPNLKFFMETINIKETPHVEKDEHTMRVNEEKEWPFIEEAERYNVKMIEENENLGHFILNQLNKEFVLLHNTNEYSINWDTIPVVRKDLKLLLNYISHRWKELFPKYFHDQKFVKPFVASLTRTQQQQWPLWLHNAYAVSPEHSTHVRGLALDFGVITITRNMMGATEFNNPANAKIKEGIIETIQKMLKEIVVGLSLHTVNGKSIIANIIEGGGSFHVSINPDPDALAELRNIIGH